MNEKSNEEQKEKIITKNLWEALFDVEQQGKFYHYTKQRAIKSILEAKEIRLYKNNNQNDNNDENSDCYILCLTTSSVENIPMWYLYSGVKGNGICLGITLEGIKKIISDCFYYMNELEKIKIPAEKIEILFKPVLYYESEKTKDKNYTEYCRIKFNHNVYYTTNELIEDFKNNHSSFCKKMEWSYEKETRLNIRIKDNELREKIGNYIFFDISKYKQNLSIKLGPNFKNEEIKKIIVEFLGENKTKYSSLRGNIDMKLCENCICKKIGL